MKIKKWFQSMGLGHLFFSLLAVAIGIALLIIAQKQTSVACLLAGGGVSALSLFGALLIYFSNRYPLGRILGISAAVLVLLIGLAVVLLGEPAFPLLSAALCLYLAVDGAFGIHRAMLARSAGIRGVALPLILGSVQLTAAFVLLCAEMMLPALSFAEKIQMTAGIFFLDALGNALSPWLRIATTRTAEKQTAEQEAALRAAWEQEWRTKVADPDREMSEEEKARREERIRAEERIRTEERLRLEAELRGNTEGVDEQALRARIREDEERIRADERARIETELRLRIETEARRCLEEERRRRMEAEERLRAETEERLRVEDAFRRQTAAPVTDGTDAYTDAPPADGDGHLDAEDAYTAEPTEAEAPAKEPPREEPPREEPPREEPPKKAPRRPSRNHAMDEAYTDGRRYGRGDFYGDE